ncbi:MAG: DUF2490 domain-containing protein [Bacteroidetes bacterium]|nr:DUF2490 domain-containing protein [Bacteroidota bacterium]
MKSILYIIVLVLPTLTNAQKSHSEFGNWIMVFNQTRVHEKWSIHSEAQFRSYSLDPNTEQILLRGGVNFHLNKSVVCTGGYGWITNYTDDGEIIKDQHTQEHRTWQQASLKNNYGRIQIEHRYRLEQRWINNNKSTNHKDRIRYLLRVTFPFNKKEMVKNALFASFYNEVFIHFQNEPFDRNRLYGALGFQFTDRSNIQLGYLAQTVNKTTKHYLQLAVNYNIDFRKVDSKQ